MREPSPLRGGARVSEELKNVSDGLDNESKSKETLLKKETSRLDDEKKESDTNFKKLNDQNKKSRSKRAATEEARWEVIKVSSTNEKNNYDANYQLQKLKKKKEEELKTSNEKLAQELKKNVEKTHAELKKVIDDENNKLKDALTSLTASNQALIAKVKECIDKLPESIFDFSLSGKDYCDAVTSSSKKN